MPMKITATKMTLMSEPEVVPTKSNNVVVNVQLMDEVWSKKSGNWEKTGENTYKVVCFGKTGEQMMMHGSGEVIDWEGKIVQDTWTHPKFKKEITSTKYIMDSFTLHQEE